MTRKVGLRIQHKGESVIVMTKYRFDIGKKLFSTWTPEGTIVVPVSEDEDVYVDLWRNDMGDLFGSIQESIDRTLGGVS